MTISSKIAKNAKSTLLSKKSKGPFKKTVHSKKIRKSKIPESSSSESSLESSEDSNSESEEEEEEEKETKTVETMSFNDGYMAFKPKVDNLIYEDFDNQDIEHETVFHVYNHNEPDAYDFYDALASVINLCETNPHLKDHTYHPYNCVRSVSGGLDNFSLEFPMTEAALLYLRSTSPLLRQINDFNDRFKPRIDITRIDGDGYTIKPHLECRSYNGVTFQMMRSLFTIFQDEGHHPIWVNVSNHHAIECQDKIDKINKNENHPTELSEQDRFTFLTELIRFNLHKSKNFISLPNNWKQYLLKFTRMPINDLNLYKIGFDFVLTDLLKYSLPRNGDKDEPVTFKDYMRKNGIFSRALKKLILNQYVPSISFYESQNPRSITQF